jgi:hypothetical protein
MMRVKIMKNGPKYILFVIAMLCIFLIIEKYDESQQAIDDEFNNSTTEIVDEGVIEEKELTEEEYKALCEEMYNDHFFKETPTVGTLAKVHVMISEKYKYNATDVFGMVVDEITEKYDLEKNSLGCTVMHESTKDSTLPSYFGKQIYLMFEKEAEFKMDNFELGQKVVVYGEIIQNTNGSFLLLKYIE